MVLDDNTLLQINTTAVAGILVLLTIYSLKTRIPHSPESRKQKTIEYTQAIVMGSVIPFSISAIMILNSTCLGLAVKCPGLSVNFTTGGFIYLIVGIIVIVLIPRLSIKENTVTGK
jgi:hypothetical protein